MADDQAEKHTNAGKIERLIKQRRGLDNKLATERQAWGDTLTKAVDNDHLNKWAFGVTFQLSKKDPARAAHDIRALMLYIDHLGLAAQTDLEDAVDATNEGDTKGAAAGGTKNVVDLGAVREVLANGGTAALDRLRRALNDTEDAKAINKGVRAFVKDWPQLKAQADEIAEARIAQLPAAEEAKPGGRRRRGAAAAQAGGEASGDAA